MTGKIVLTRDKHIINIYNTDLKKSLRYDLKDKCMQKKDKEGKWYEVKQQYEFFKGYRMSDIECEEEKFKGMVEQTSKLNPLCTSISSFIARMNDALVYENYIAEGIDTDCISGGGYCGYRRVLSKPLEFYSKNTIKFFKNNNIKVTVTIERLFKDDYEFAEKMILALDSCDVDSECKRDLMTSMNRYGSCFRYIKQLVNEYNYNIKSLLSYILNYLKPFENIGTYDSITLLKDYYSMSNTIGRNVKKYPKYLRSMHDIITANYNAHKEEYDELRFKELQKIDLEFANKKFCIRVPKESKDIISEGTSLNHCVSSYVKRVLKEETYIMFLRKTEEEDRSLVTLELKNNKIVQAKGSYNRTLDEEERKFLDQYCKKLKLGLEV